MFRPQELSLQNYSSHTTKIYRWKICRDERIVTLFILAMHVQMKTASILSKDANYETVLYSETVKTGSFD